MRTPTLLVVLSLAFSSTPVPAQHVLFEEDFESGIPATWTNIQIADQQDRWRAGFQLVDGTRDVNHEWFCHFGFFLRDNILLSPPIDLSSVSNAWVEFGQWQRFPTRRSYNGIEITTNGGQSYTVVYTETGTWSGFGSTKVDISAFAGRSNVQVAFHYRGIVANDWSIDNVRVTTSPLHHTAARLVQGQMALFAASGATPGNSLVLGLSPQAGPVPTPWGNVNLSLPIITLPTLTADASGNAMTSVQVPQGLSGAKLHTQFMEFALPLGSVVKISNSLALMIQ